MSGTLFVVGTPIGNLDDVSQRAAETIREAELCYAEDTRRTRTLLDRIGARTPVRSLREHNERSRIDEVLERLGRGERIALVCDAGTPTISDPGRRVLEAALAARLTVSPVPGPSAVIAALSVSGLAADRFQFVGFAPRRGKARATWLEQVCAARDTVVAFEAPTRLVALLDAMAGVGMGGRRTVVCRELTKLHEEVVAGSIEELATVYRARTVKGEVTLVIAGAGLEGDGISPEAVREMARDLAASGASRRDIADRLIESYGISRNEAYRISLAAEKGMGTDE